LTATAEEDSSLASGVIDGMRDVGENIQNIGANGLRQIIGLIPFIGVVLFLIGVAVAVFSVRNKGNRRWGLKLAISEAIITYLLFIAFTLVYDIAYKRYPVRYTSRPKQETIYENAYYNAVDELKEEGRGFLFFERGWMKKSVVAGRKMYTSVAPWLAFVSFSSGVLLFILTKRDVAIRRLAVAGMCVVVPVALMVGYRFLKV